MRVVVTTVIACVAIILALVQFASDALYKHSHEEFGLRVYRAIDRIAPAEYVSDTLAQMSLQAGDLDAAQHYAVQMPAGERRDDTLAQIAAARGDDVLAREYYFAATDVAAMQHEIATIARYNIFDALATEARFREWLIEQGTHPDAVAESYYYSGIYASRLGRYPDALAFDERALALAPMNMAYVLSAATSAYFSGDLSDAQRFYTRGIAVNPADGNAYAGLGLVALRRGDRARAQAYLAKARAVDPTAPTVASLAAELR